MRRARSIPLAAAVTAASLSSAAFAQVAATSQPAAMNADVPVKRVSLFSSGVGFFERGGKVVGDGDATLTFRTEQISDVLKSLVVSDAGGHVSGVSYQSQDPLEKTLAGFQIDLTGEPALAQIFKQLRGAEVRATVAGNVISGTVLGVETRKKPVGDKNVVDLTILNLVTPTGIQGVAIEEAQTIQLVDANLQKELSQALAAVAGARGADKKTVTVHFTGTGERNVRLGYVVATPIWKASYRLTLPDAAKPDEKKDDKKKADLQGWAVVENQTDSDWNDVALSLVSGRPMSFTMDLYEPMYLPRPEAKLELFAGLTPQTYAESRNEEMRVLQQATQQAGQAGRRGGGGGGGGFGGANGPMAPAAAPMGSVLAKDSLEEISDGALAQLQASNASIVNRATGGAIGQLFAYSIDDVTVPRQSSAMVPIVTDPIDATAVSIFNSSVLARYPLNGARLTNTTDKHLLQGPVTVFQGGSYAGDAQINNVPPGQSRLISFGVDLQVIVDADKNDSKSELTGVKIVRGAIQARRRETSARHYDMTNKSPAAKLVIVEHPKLPGWELADTDKPAETTDALYRFDRSLKAGESSDFVVTQQRTRIEAIGFIDTDLNYLISLSKDAATPDKVKEAIGKAIALRQEQLTFQRTIDETNAQLAQITAEQNRIRENLKTIDKTSAYYGRLMKKLDEQETQIDDLHKKVDEATTSRDAKRGELEKYLNGLNVE